ncbi:hypothetical protein [Siminovitchia fordii]|uniref:hypothetical protein n=1 Tax=Siminovitchia fordii TaxID=254759 RepID=UPI00036C342D|nr:hypothetical protein [Siminovitchia fordii]
MKSFKKLLWLDHFISAIGGGFTSFGLGIYVFQQTGKASAMELVILLVDSVGRNHHYGQRWRSRIPGALSCVTSSL